MALALQLAKQGSGCVNPNPLVGAVIVKNDHVIGKGYHTRYGSPHAEREALANCCQSPIGATLCNANALLPSRENTTLY